MFFLWYNREVLSIMFKKILFILGIILLILLGWFFYRYQYGTKTSTPDLIVAESKPKEITTKKVETKQAPVAESASFFGTANFESESFRIGDIAIGGESQFLLSEDTPDPLTITGIRGETFTEKNKPEVKLIITWKTNKLAQSDISYAKGTAQTKKVVNEPDYTTNHSLILPGLEQSATYIYTIVSRDRFGNEVTSDQHAIYTGAKTVSLFDLISGAVGDVFGWAVKK